MSSATEELGAAGERLAADHLQSRGYRILERRYRTRLGEVDLIASAGDTLVFLEVKTRRGDRFGSPLESVNARKRERLARAAAQYLATGRRSETTVRFDVIGIVWPDRGRPVLDHVEDAFRLD